MIEGIISLLAASMFLSTVVYGHIIFPLLPAVIAALAVAGVIAALVCWVYGGKVRYPVDIAVFAAAWLSLSAIPIGALIAWSGAPQSKIAAAIGACMLLLGFFGVHRAYKQALEDTAWEADNNPPEPAGRFPAERRQIIAWVLGIVVLLAAIVIWLTIAD